MRLGQRQELALPRVLSLRDTFSNGAWSGIAGRVDQRACAALPAVLGWPLEPACSLSPNEKGTPAFPSPPAPAQRFLPGLSARVGGRNWHRPYCPVQSTVCSPARGPGRPELTGLEGCISNKRCWEGAQGHPDECTGPQRGSGTAEGKGQTQVGWGR